MPVAAIPAAERRHVAIVVTTITGYAALLEELAPAALETVVAQLRAEAVDVVRRHGGVVNQAVGEEIVALFGIPASHEDDELRAVRAAMELMGRARTIALPPSSRDGLMVTVHAASDRVVVVQRLREGPRRYHVSGDAARDRRPGWRRWPCRAPCQSPPSVIAQSAIFLRPKPEASTALRPGTAPIRPHRIPSPSSAVPDRFDSIDRPDLSPTRAGPPSCRASSTSSIGRAPVKDVWSTIIGEAGMEKAACCSSCAGMSRSRARLC